MKHKRLNRDQWGFQYYPYYQMRIDDPLFHGLACLIRLTDGKANYWEMPKAGRIQVTGAGMTWLELIPDGQNRVITVVYFPRGTHDPERKNYPSPAMEDYQPSFWYVDVIDGIEYDDCGIAVFIDQYIDVIFSPEGDVKIDDGDELEAAFTSGELTRDQYESALAECDSIQHDLCTDIPETDRWCAQIRQHVEERIRENEPILAGREVLELQKEWTIRLITREEVPACVDVIRKSFQTVADEFGFTVENAPRFTAFAISEERVARGLAYGEGVIGCFDREGQMVGCVTLALLHGLDVCELKHLSVLPEYRHRHLGKMLVQYALCQGYTHYRNRIMLDMVEENTRLKRWYENFGFVTTQTVKYDFFPFTCGTMERPLP